VIGHPSDRLFEEVAYVAYHFHWPHAEVMELDHLERRRWVAEIARINERVNAAAAAEEEPWPR
jgi:hypothetical protein